MNIQSLRRMLLAAGATLLLTLAMSSSAYASNGFEAEEYPATVTSTGGTHKLTFPQTVGESSVSCSEGTFGAQLASANLLGASSATNWSCSPFYTLKMNGCRYTFDPGGGEEPSEGTVSIGPPGCGPIVLNGPVCTGIPAQIGLEASYLSTGTGVRVELEAEGLEYNAECGSGQAYADGKWSGTWDIDAQGPEGESQTISTAEGLQLTTLCNESGASCATPYAAGTSIQASSSEAKITSLLPSETPISTKCTSSSIEGQTLAGGATPLPVEISNWELSGCTLLGNSCTVTALDLPYTGVVTEGESNDGSLTVEPGGSGGEPGWRIQCSTKSGPVDCSVRFEPVLDIESGSTGSIVGLNEPMINGEEAEAEEFAECHGTVEAKFSASYSVSSPEPLYVAAG